MILQVTIVLSGSDNRVHLFTEDSNTHIAQEKIANDEFPEFGNEFPSVVLWIEFHILKEKSLRLTAVGCECGGFFLYVVDIESNSIKSYANVNHGTSVTSSKFFDSSDSIHLLVTSSLLPATVYRYYSRSLLIYIIYILLIILFNYFQQECFGEPAKRFCDISRQR